MITIHPNVARFARPFTEILDHPISCSGVDRDTNAIVLNSLRRSVTTAITNLIDVMRRSPNYTVKEHAIARLLEDSPLVCPECHELITSVNYASDVREFGSATISVMGVDNYNCNDSETTNTEFTCHECDSMIEEDELPVYCATAEMALINDFVSNLLDRAYGEISMETSPAPAPAQQRTTQWVFRSSMDAITAATTAVASGCEGACPIREGITVTQDLFDN